MSEEKKKRIIIASVLKPVDDTRMFGKIALSLSTKNAYEIHVIGFPATTNEISQVRFHPLPFFHRLSAKRLSIPWIILRKILALRPSILIITTHELLWISLLAKAMTSCRLIYDIQENYFLNILYTDSFPAMVRPLLAIYVRLKEILTSFFIDRFFLAEKGYENELSFVRGKSTVLGNKVRKPKREIKREPNPSHITLLFSGTLAESTGVFTAIELATKLHDLDPSINLTIMGFCAREETLFKIKNTIEPYPFIQLIGGDKLVPHHLIVEEIMKADFGIIAYPYNQSTASSIPTKLYEYLGYRLPILLVDHQPWASMCADFQAAVVFDPHRIHAASIYKTMKTQKFYTAEPEDVYWESEEIKLFQAV
jgi:hypothetical protein